MDELFLWAWSQGPTPEQRAVALAHVQKHAANKKIASENILGALINTKEFVFNQ